MKVEGSPVCAIIRVGGSVVLTPFQGTSKWQMILTKVDGKVLS